ncbi:MAG TPA: hypothetical protein VHT01_00270 [Candidatus Udaeobacter sp.]|jgi:hypothetical protein|nr:hypothetical protein [Candidatus Udaeobacter sp.]
MSPNTLINESEPGAEPATQAEDAPLSLAQRVVSFLGLALINLVVFAVLAEAASIAIVHFKRWPSTRPTYHLSYNKFWTETNPVFGMWHRPNGHFFHQGGCFSVEYTTNSYGARDRERTLHTTKPRTIVLGDSFVEGFGVPDDERLTNLMERDAGREHLNFGTGGGFSPLQYALLYRSLASQFDHTQVLVGVLPDNDFHEMDRSWLESNYAGEFRPYYRDDLTIGYLGHFQPNAGEGLWNHTEAALRAYLASYHVGQYIYFSTLMRHGPYSGYNDFKAVDLARLKQAVLDIKSTAVAHGAKMAVFIIPRANDFERLHTAKTDRLGPVMESWGTTSGIPVKDLLPDMEAQSGGDYRSYFRSCDGHWSTKGNAVAAKILEHWVYGQ